MIRLYNDKESEGSCLIPFLLTIAFWVLVIVTCIIQCSCKTQEKIMTVVHTDTLYKARKDSIIWKTYTNIIDSFKLRDSVVIRTDAGGNVLGTDTWHWREHYRNQKDSTNYYKTLFDSVANIKRDSVLKPYPVTTIKTIYRQTKFQKALCWLGGIVLISALGYFIYKKRKYIIKVIRLFI